MPNRDKTGPDGTFVNCMPAKNEEDSEPRNFFMIRRNGFGNQFRRFSRYNPRGILRPRFRR
ncbi:MAG: hypothetical protein ACLFPQ_04970 [Candidatus Woesearchaeota archaeon]